VVFCGEYKKKNITLAIVYDLATIAHTGYDIISINKVLPGVVSRKKQFLPTIKAVVK